MKRSQSRKKDVCDFHHRYRFMPGNRSKNNLYWECVYCGDPATERDHCPPISRVCDYEALGLKHEKYLLVPSCARCNRLLSDSLQESILHRIEHLKDILQKKYARHMSFDEWDADELKAIGPNLKSHINAAGKKAKLAKKAIEYYVGYDKIQDAVRL